MHRQRYHFARQPLRNRKRTRSQSEIIEGRLKMQRNRVMHRGSDTAVSEMRAERVAPRYASDKQVIDRLAANLFARADDTPREQLAIPSSDPTKTLVPGFEIVCLHPQHGGLQIVEARRLPDDRMFVLADAAVVAQQANTVGDAVVVRRNQTGGAESTQVLGRVKT